MTDIYDKTNDIKTRDDFVKFVDVLKEDFIYNQESWANTSLDTFFDAMSAWLRDIDKSKFIKQNYADELSVILSSNSSLWKEFAIILYMSKTYE